MDSGKTVAMPLGEMRSAISAALAKRTPEPLLSNPETIIRRPNPRIWLALAIREMTSSNLLAWQIAKNTCSLARARDSGCGAPREDDILALRSAIRLVLSAFRRSPEDALQVSRGIAALSGCRKDHLAQFLDFLAPIAEGNPSFAFTLMDNFSADPRDSRLLGFYNEAVSISFRKGGEEAASSLSSLFREVGRFSESARLMLEELIFTFRSMPVQDWKRFVSSFCEDWRKTLISDAFAKNPD